MYVYKYGYLKHCFNGRQTFTINIYVCMYEVVSIPTRSEESRANIRCIFLLHSLLTVNKTVRRSAVLQFY